jgi:hypothetical protein
MLDKVDPVHDFLVAWEKQGTDGPKSLDRAAYVLRCETNKYLNGKFILAEDADQEHLGEYTLYSLNGVAICFADDPQYGEERLSDLPWFVGPNAQSITVFGTGLRNGETLKRRLDKMQWRGRKPHVVEGY